MMTSDGHYDEEVLIALLDEGGDEALDRDPHIAACPACSKTLASVRELADVLKSPDVWNATEISPEPNANVLAFLTHAQSDFRAEDAAAESWVHELLAQPREAWAPTLHAHPEWRTAGMVRKLIDGSERRIKTTPPDAVEATKLAVEIVDALDQPCYGEPTINRLRGRAWRERAYALYFTGSYQQALSAIECSREAFASIVDAEFDNARSIVVYALICAEQQKFGQSLAAARQAADIFSRYGATTKMVTAKRTEASILYGLRRYREALAIYHSLESHSHSVEERAGLCQNIAVCYQELGDFEAAGRYFTIAMDIASKRGLLTIIARARWQFALVLLAQGRSTHALDMLRDVRDEFVAAQMAHDVAEVTTEIAHTLMIAGRVSEVADECRQALAYFDSVNLTATPEAMSAIALLHEAAAAGRIEEKIVAEIRTTVIKARPSQLYIN
jgi:tetratricopeptide (TPR) repeat protein